MDEDQLYAMFSRATDPISFAFELLSIKGFLSLEEIPSILDAYSDLYIKEKRLDRPFPKRDTIFLKQILFWTLLSVRNESTDQESEDYTLYGTIYTKFLGNLFTFVLEEGNKSSWLIHIHSAKDLLMKMIERYPSPLIQQLIPVVEQINDRTPISFLSRIYREILTGQGERGYESSHFSDIVSDLDSLDPDEIRANSPLREEIEDYQQLREALPFTQGRRMAKRNSRTKKCPKGKVRGQRSHRCRSRK